MRTRAHWQTIACLALAAVVARPACAQTYTISTVAGAGAPSNVPGKSTGLGLRLPQFLTADSTGDVYFVDQNAVVRLDAKTGILTVVAGTGETGYTGDNGPATSARLRSPQGLAVDSSGDLYIADAGNYVVREVSNGTITTVAGTGAKGTACAGGPALSTGLNSPYGMAVNSAGNLYIADSANNCVLKVANGTMAVVAGTGTPGFAGDGGQATSARLSGPVGVAFDTAGNLYIADQGNNTVREVTAATGIINTVAGGSNCFCGNPNNGPATAAALVGPSSIAVDSSGSFYFSDGDCIRKVAKGTLTTVAGSSNSLGESGFSGDGGLATSALLAVPESIAFDAAANLYIADSLNSRIREVSLGIINTIVGNGLIGDNGPATAAQLYGPAFLALDAAHNLYISDPFMFLVRKVSASTGTITTVAGNGSLNGVTATSSPATQAAVAPEGLAVDPAGNLYIADPSHWVIWEVSNGTISRFAGSFNEGYTNNAQALAASLWGPLGLAVDSGGNVFFSDTTQAAQDAQNVPVDHIAKVSDGVVTTFAGNGSQGSSGDNGPALFAEFASPAGLAFDAAGDLLISDTANSKIRMVAAQTGIVTTIAGNGTQGYGGDNGPATQASLDLGRGWPAGATPSGVAVDKAGNLYIADSGNHRVRKVSASTGNITTIAGNGTGGFSGDYGPATSAEMADPLGVAVDSVGNVFVADGFRVRVLTPSTGSGCAYSATPTSLQPAASGANETVSVQTSAYCPWTIAGLPEWITISGPAAGTGPGSVTLSVAANTGVARSATITIAGASVSIAQAGAIVGPTIGAVVNAEGNAPTIAPNTWLTIYGSNLAPPGDSRPWQASDFVNNQMPVALDGVSVTVNGKAAYIYYISPTQVNILTPPDAMSGSVPVQVTNNAVMSPVFTAQAQAESPSFFVFANGPYVAATHADGSLLGPASLYPGSTTPAQPGEEIVIYANGFGPTSVQVVSGAVSQSGTLSPLPVIQIGGVTAEVKFAGLNITPGEFQFNVVVPASLADGDQSITATYNNLTTQAGTLLTVHH